jgi:LEA14-like dessication related protein
LNTLIYINLPALTEASKNGIITSEYACEVSLIGPSCKYLKIQMKTIRRKGEKMSLRKGLTLLLLAAFGLSTVAPALAINVNQGVVFNTVAQDDGTASTGAKQDVVATNILFDLNNAGDLFLAGDGAAGTDAQNIAAADTATFTTAGVITPGGGAAAFTVPSPAATLFVPPTGCKFVKLPGYVEGSATFTIPAASANLYRNVTVANESNLPTESFIVAQVLDAVPATISNNATAATFTNGGVLALHTFTGAESATQNSALVRVTLANIGLACDANSAAAVSGDVNVTVVQPNQGAYVPALPNLTSLSTIKVAEFGNNVGKLQALIAGDTVGNTSGTAEDQQANALVSNVALQSVTTVNFGPAEATGILSNVGYLDVDAILIRAAETPNSTSVSPVYYQTPFATAKFVSTKNLNGDAVELTDANLANSALFDNETNALITVDIEITSFAGGSSSATLAVTNAFVGIEGPNTPTTNGTGTANGFLGAVANPVLNDNDDNPATAQVAVDASTDAGIIAVDPAQAANFIVDGHALGGGLLVPGLGFDEITTVGPLQTGVVVGDVTAVATVNGTTTTFTSVNTDRGFLFPGVFVDDTSANGGGASSFTIENLSSKNATTTVFTTSTNANPSVGEIYRNARTVFSNLLPAVATTAGAQYHIVAGDDTIATVHTAKANQVLGITNFSEETTYNQGPQVGSADAVRLDNVVLASKLTSAGTGKKFTVNILPFTNKFDGLRDVISVRPKGTITLSSAALTEGVKLIAKVSGNNLNGTTTLTLASIIPAGSVTSAITSRILPVNGAQNRLLSYNTGTPATGRSLVDTSTLTGTSSLLDSLEDIVGSGKTLDTTVPPLFAGGLAGNTSTGAAARGPRAIVQPKARALALEEAANGDFKVINDLGANARIRITLPVGTDINLYSSTATSSQTNTEIDNILSVFGTAGMTAPTVANTILNVQRVSSTAAQAFIDIKVPAVSTTTLPIKRGLYIVFRPDALVVPKGVTNLNATVSVIDNSGTAAVYTDDVTLGTLSTVALAPAVSKFLELSFAPQATSAFRSGTVTPTAEQFVRSTVETKYGAQNTLFPSTFGSTLRFVNNAAVTNTERLWDLQIKEGVADAFPIGTDVDGIPTVLADEASDGTAGFINPNDTGANEDAIPVQIADISLADVAVVCAASDNLTFAAAVDNNSATGTTGVFFSDSSITVENTATAVQEIATDDNSFAVRLAAGSLTGAPRAADTQTTMTITGLRYRGPGSTPPTDTDIACWVEVDGTDGVADQGAAGITANDNRNVIIGSSASKAFGGESGTPTQYIGVYTNIAEVRDLLVDARFGATAPAATVLDVDNATNLANGLFNSAFLSADDFINNALTFKVDDSSSALKLLDGNTALTVTTATLPTVNGLAVTGGDVQVTVSAAAGKLEPGTIINVTTSSPSTESVRVPVLADGSFKAVLRSSPTAILTLTQTPTTNKTGANIQVKTVDLSAVTNDPAFNGVVPTLLTSTIANKGSVVALFNTPAVTGFTFTDVEATAKVNGVAVTKVATGKYAAIVPATASTFTLTVTVDGEPVTTTLTLATVTATGKAVPAIGTVNVKADDSVVVNVKNAGTTFPSDLSFEIVYTDGTTAVVANSAVALKKAGARAKFANPEAAKTIAFVQAVSAGGSRAKSL